MIKNNTGMASVAVLTRIRRKFTKRLKSSPKAKQPNAETLAAMQELADGKGRRFKNSKEFYRELGI